MNIVLDKNHRVVSDPLNIILEEKRIAQKGKNEGQEIWVTVGYYSTIQGCLKGYLHKRIKGSDAESIDKLINEVSKVEKIIKEIRI